MREIKKVLIPVDLSAPNDEFLNYSKFVVNGLKAEGILMHVMPDILGGYIPYDIVFEELEKTVESLKSSVESALQELADKYGFAYAFDVGSPYAKIVEFVEKEKIDFVVVNGGKPGEEIGTQAHKITRKASVPVLVYKNHEPKIKKILFTTDLSEKAEEAFPCALLLKEKFGARLTAFHVVEPISGYFDESMIGGIPLLDVKELENVALKNLKEKFKEADEHVVEVGAPTPQVIMDYAKENGYDVIVMATHGRSGLEKILLGSVTEKIVRFSHVPVLVSRV